MTEEELTQAERFADDLVCYRHDDINGAGEAMQKLVAEVWRLKEAEEFRETLLGALAAAGWHWRSDSWCGKAREQAADIAATFVGAQQYLAELIYPNADELEEA